MLVQVPQWSPELPGKGIMTMMLCYNNRPPTLSLIPVIYNRLGQNKSKELELWPNNEYEIRPYSFQHCDCEKGGRAPGAPPSESATVQS